MCKKNMVVTLKNYKHKKAKLKQIMNELNFIKVSSSNIEGDRIQAGGVSDPTFKSVRERERLHENYQRLFYEVETVENFLDALTSEQRKIIECRYFELLRVGECLRIVNIERHVFYIQMDKIHEIFEHVTQNK